MGKGIRYSGEFKQEAVNQVVVHGYSVSEVADRLGISSKTLYGWVKKLSKPTVKRLCCSTESSGLLKLFRQIYSFEACPTT
ncbi:transposase [Zooshikella ganghwensis]|uniref:Transposase n=1 Tax=Zooshikella ganghwensis TaxID=202772 RepID=A0A4P9VJE5_9GAMM|nr:transposase [Zooshikella ganghwensis]RDH41882.1 transposase [Zooshikella ganghwensis]